jgi:hypothetical protein
MGFSALWGWESAVRACGWCFLSLEHLIRASREWERAAKVPVQQAHGWVSLSQVFSEPSNRVIRWYTLQSIQRIRTKHGIMRCVLYQPSIL